MRVADDESDQAGDDAVVLQDSESEVVVGELEERVDDAVVEALFGRVVEESDEEREAAALSQLHPVGKVSKGHHSSRS